MATKTIKITVDDLNGEELKPGEYQTIRFAIDGKTYSIDLGKVNAEQFLALLAPYIAVARPERDSRARTRKTTTSSDAIRDWARANGHQVADRGRVPQAVVDAYQAAH